MIPWEILFRFIISLAIGAFIGIERELDVKGVFFGVRTFMLVTFFGTLSALIGATFDKNFFLIGFITLSVIVLATFVIVHRRQDMPAGVTTEFAVILAYLTGFLLYFEKTAGLGVVFGIVIALLLSEKFFVKKFLKKFNKDDYLQSLKFVIVAFVILPFLPNTSYGWYGFFNPYHVWLMVVFVSGISFVAFLLSKFFSAKKGIFASGVLGGFISSTAVTISLSSVGKNLRVKCPVVFAIIIASSTMFLRMLVELYVLNKELFFALLTPLLVMGVGGVLIGYFFFRKSEKKEVAHDVPLSSPFALKPALHFGLFFALILLLSKAALSWWGDQGIFIAAIISGFADVDAITLSVSRLAGDTLSMQYASLAILIGGAVNTLVKAGFAWYFGGRDLGMRVLALLSTVLLLGFVTVALLL
ncbi:MAG: MgtC/SapB family protein [Candidatus Woesearchaeota archaeon]|nr:MAG: MgtC/SapB family protein [Candidatus Woesearchaeota archaeon]